MAVTLKVLKAEVIDYDPKSGAYMLKTDPADTSNPDPTIRAWYPNGGAQHPAGPNSLDTIGHVAKGTWVVVDVTFPGEYVILRVAPSNISRTLGVATKSVVPRDLGGNSVNKELSRKLNNSFESSSSDDILVGPQNRGSSSFWGACYGHTAGHAFLKASAMSSVETFLYDNLVRIKGDSLQTWTALGERNITTSGDTATEGIEETHFIHESLGRNRKEEKFGVYSGFATAETDKAKAASVLRVTVGGYLALVAEAAQDGEDSVEARLKLEEVHQRYEQHQVDHPKMLPRRVKLNGYLGHGESDFIVKSTAVHNRLKSEAMKYTFQNYHSTGLPEEVGFNKGYINAYTTYNVPSSTGLSEIQRASDGRVRVASAKSISLVKEVSIPVPSRVEEDPDTTLESFIAPVFVDKLLIDPQESSDLFDKRELASRAHDRQFVDKHPEWVYNKVTGGVLEKSLATKPHGTGSDYRPDHLATHTYAIPPSVTLEVDEKTNSKYYKGRAGVFMTDDGGIVMRDAYGGSIRMTGGNIYLDCPGDIIEMPGRDKVVMAGRTATLQAKGDTEIVSTTGATRIKADTQLSMMGGASGLGGVIIESKAIAAEPTEEGSAIPGEGSGTSSGGIVVKSPSYISVETPVLGVTAETTTIMGLVAVIGDISAMNIGAMNITAEGMTAGLIFGNAVWTRELFALVGLILLSPMIPILGGAIGMSGVPAGAITGMLPPLGPLGEAALVEMFGEEEEAPAEEEEPVEKEDETEEDDFEEEEEEPAKKEEPSLLDKLTGAVSLSPDIGALTAAATEANAFAAANFFFSFNSSEEYGLNSSPYKFELMEPVWQSRERKAGAGASLWESKAIADVAIGFSQPYPGDTMLNSASFKRPMQADTFTLEPGVNDLFEVVPLKGNLRVN